MVIGGAPSGTYIEFPHLVSEYPPVSRALLNVHASIAEIIHLISAGEAIDSIL